MTPERLERLINEVLKCRMSEEYKCKIIENLTQSYKDWAERQVW